MDTPVSTSLERALRRFDENPLSAEAARADLDVLIEDLARKRAEHPGLFFLSDLQMRYAALYEFMQGAETVAPDKDRFARMRDFVNALYTLDCDGVTWHNLLLQIDNDVESRITEDVLDDLRRNAPSVTKEMIATWCSMIKELEAKRMQVLASVALLAKPDGSENESHRTATMLHLEQSWSNFHKSFRKISKSPELTYLFAAVDEMQKSVGKPVPLAYLPKRLYMRREDYSKGRKEFELIDDPEEAPVSLDQIAEEHEGETPFPDPNTDIRVEAVEVRRMLEILPTKERDAVEKYARGEKLSVAERKAKSRGIKRLREQNA